MLDCLPNAKESIDRTKERAAYKVAIFSASSNGDLSAVANAGEAGKIIAKNGYGLVNGGYASGGMGSSSEGFDIAATESGQTLDEIAKRKSGVVFSDKIGKIAKNFKTDIGFIKNAQITEEDDLPARAGGIIRNADAYIITEGGTGTDTEGHTTLQNEGLRQLAEGNPQRPIIIVDKHNIIVHQLLLREQVTPGSVKKMSENIFILAGHSAPSTDDIKKANLENDPEMKENLANVLRLFFLKKISAEEITPEEKEEIEVLTSEVKNKVLNLKAYSEKRQTFDEGGGI